MIFGTRGTRTLDSFGPFYPVDFAVHTVDARYWNVTLFSAVLAVDARESVWCCLTTSIKKSKEEAHFFVYNESSHWLAG